MKKIVVALGGNALGKTPTEQLKILESVSKILVGLIKDGNRVVLTHGNGPQVGAINLAMEYASNGKVKTPDMPFAECGSMSQGYIGYQLQQCLQDELERCGIVKNCATLITQVLVDKKDKAFKNPTKPIGDFYTRSEALKIENEKGYIMKEDAGRGFRRVVPSPEPIDIIEKNVIKKLVDDDIIVIACGGGGIPVVKTNKIELLEGVDAVIDKDKTASLLAKLIDADMLLILTSIDKVYINFNTENQTGLDDVDINDLKYFINSKEFASGSMLPKIEACMAFVENDDKKIAIISSLENALDAINGKKGTTIRRRK
mgnify:FL=1